MDLLQSLAVFWVVVVGVAAMAAPAGRRLEDLLLLVWVGLTVFLVAALWGP